MRTIRILSLILALFMFLAAFAACGQSGGKETEKATTPGGDKETQGESGPQETETEAIKPTTLPAKTDYDFAFNVLHWTVGDQSVGEGWVPWEEIAVEEDNGDGIVKVIFDRNNQLEEEYGIHVSVEYMNTDPITSTVMS